VHASRRCSLWLDEVWTLHDTLLPWGALLSGPSREHPPLMYWFVRASLALFGHSETALRAVSLGFGCVLLVAIYQLCRELEFDAPSSLVIVISVALAPFFVFHAIEARHYAMLPALTTLATVFALRLLREPDSRRSLVGFALSAAGAGATHYFGLLYVFALLGALAIGTFALWKGRVQRVPITTALVLAALGLVLALVTARAALLAFFYTKHRIGPGQGDLLRAARGDFAFLWNVPAAAHAEPFVAAAGLVFVGLRQKGIARAIPFGLAFLPCLLASLISTGHFVASRYLAPSFVFYQLGATSAFVALSNLVRGSNEYARLVRWTRRLVAAAILLVPLCLRALQYPAAFGVGRNHYAGLQSYFTPERARTTALVVFPAFPGMFIIQYGYPVNAPTMALEKFEPVPGIEDYVIAEFERSNQQRSIEPLIAHHFHVSPRHWEAQPLLKLEKSEFQPPVRARLLRLER
jgi:4-amino-4-deoxy-L-arabinose transferase-like glycosyltransferase